MADLRGGVPLVVAIHGRLIRGLSGHILGVVMISVNRAIVAVAASAGDRHQCRGGDRRVDQQERDKTRTSGKAPVGPAPAVRRVQGVAHASV